LELAKRGGYSGIVLHYGLARKYMRDFTGEVPLVLKLNGKTDIPPDDEAFSPQTANVQDAVYLGADAVGYTLYVGSPRQDDDFRQLMTIRDDCNAFGMPLIVWSYPRGSAVEKKGGRDSIFAVDYAARVACELGADLVKLNLPKIDPAKDADSPKPYNKLGCEQDEAIRRVIRNAGKTLVIISGGSKMGDDDLIDKARLVMENGATGLIFGRNMWQRPMDEALAITARIREMLLEFGD
jgi:class I fructose-bisphosphate aldolase